MYLSRIGKLSLSMVLLAFCSHAQTPKKVAPKPVAKATTTAPANSAASATRGKALYAQYCLSCHMADGGGVPNMNPPLVKTSYVSGDKVKLSKVLIKGISGVAIDGEDYHNAMASFSFMTDQQIADILTYVRSSFGNKASAVLPADVAKARK